MLLADILLANLISRLVAVGLALYFSLRILARWGNAVSAMAAGLLLTLSCTHLIPSALEHGLSADRAGIALLAGFLGFVLLDFVLERFAGHTHVRPQVRPRRDAALLGGRWRQAADEACSCCPGEVRGGGRAAVLLVGMAAHNFVDGVLIAAAFMLDAASGWMVTLAVFVHEVPQLMGQAVILTHCGWQKRRCAVWVTATAMAAVAGGAAGWGLFMAVEGIAGYAMIVSAASFLFVVLSILLPELIHDESGMPGTGRIPYQEIAALIAGVVLSLAILGPIHEQAHAWIESGSHAADHAHAPGHVHSHAHGQPPVVPRGQAPHDHDSGHAHAHTHDHTHDHAHDLPAGADAESGKTRPAGSGG